MAEATHYGNTVVSSTSSDTITGPLTVIGIKATQGTGANIISLKDAAGNVIWQAQLPANTTPQMEQFAGDGLQLSAQAYTVTQSASNGTLYIYLG